MIFLFNQYCKDHLGQKYPANQPQAAELLWNIFQLIYLHYLNSLSAVKQGDDNCKKILSAAQVEYFNLL